MNPLPDTIIYTAYAKHQQHISDISGHATVESMRAALEAANVGELIEALQFYASRETYQDHGMQDAEIFHDWGYRARAVLEKLGVTL